jgi:hypothetical protein
MNLLTIHITADTVLRCALRMMPAYRMHDIA